jgi:hypothetical protein
MECILRSDAHLFNKYEASLSHTVLHYWTDGSGSQPRKLSQFLHNHFQVYYLKNCGFYEEAMESVN